MTNGGPDAPAPLLEARGLGRRAPGDGARLLDGVSLRLGAGERVAVVGPTGSGKTLLLRALCLLDAAEEGEVLWKGSRVQDDEVPRFRGRVIYLHQTPSLPEGKVEEALRAPFGYRAHGERRFDRGRIERLLGGIGRDVSFLGMSARNLSGGEAQLAALLRAVQLDPEMLLLDEPTASLDPDSARGVEALVEDWMREGKGTRACLWVTHDAAQAGRVADRVLALRSGGLREG